MEKRYQHQQFEKKIYQEWEKRGYFTPKPDSKKEPFCIIMPPPNANGSLHIGHALFVAIEDLMIRWARMTGKAALWLPGADHAGILTQVVFERELAKKGKTRYDLGRERFWKECFDFSQRNKKTMYAQLRQLGASCDWTREKFTLDEDVTQIVYETFFKLFKDGLVYRDWRIVSWCPRCSTALSDLEVEYREEDSRLWYIKYPLEKSGEEIVVATTRPETMLGDTAVAVNPKDKRYFQLVGGFVFLPLTKRKIPIIADNSVDPEFGTGAVKVTPAHDPDDFEIGKRHNLEVLSVIGFDGKMTRQAGEKFSGLTVEQAREKVLRVLKERGLLVKEERYRHRVGHCERCKTVIQPLVSLQWFIRTKSLAQKAIEAVKKGETKIIPSYFQKTYFNWLNNIKDWCISRQLWWGHQLPIWYCGLAGLSELQKRMNPELVKKNSNNEGCGEVYVGLNPPQKCKRCGNSCFIRDPDTFDTWFSSGQWPYSTLGYPDKKDYKYFYPTSVMETGYDILFFWVARMMMLGIYRTKKVPFKVAYLHGMVRDVFGRPMSKSRPETCVDPRETVEKYGADALRMALVYGTSAGKDLVVTEEKIKGMRNFTNKIWNAARFIYLVAEDQNWRINLSKKIEHPDDKEIIVQLEQIIRTINKDFEKFRFGQALERLYQFFWHQFCDIYIEKAKTRRLKALPTLIKVLVVTLKLLHPFAPFVTEAVYQVFREKVGTTGRTNLFDAPFLIVSVWPTGADV